MARQPRLIVPDVALHIVQRGVDRQDCFSEETDRVVYLSLLRELCEETRCAVHAYCLMTNHVHLLLTPAAPDGPSALCPILQPPLQPHRDPLGRALQILPGRVGALCP